MEGWSLFSEGRLCSPMLSYNEIIDWWLWKSKLLSRSYVLAGQLYMKHALHRINSTEGKFRISRCFICLNKLDSNRHLLLHCTIVTDIWGMFFSIFGRNWVMPQSIKEAYECWSKSKVDKSITLIPACIFWCVWTEKNCRCFNGISTPTYFLEAEGLLWLYSWQNLSPVNCPIKFWSSSALEWA